MTPNLILTFAMVKKPAFFSINGTIGDLYGIYQHTPRCSIYFPTQAGFSVQAALGGAKRVTTVDISAPVVNVARKTFAHNHINPDHHIFSACDAFQFLDQAQKQHNIYDLVIVDPPSFAPAQKHKKKAISAYKRLNAAALRVVAASGTLISASCSSHITVEDLLAILQAAASEANREISVRDIRGAGSDHPVLPSFPEGRYLKLLVVSVR